MLQAPFNNVIVKPETKYIGNISKIMRLSAIQQGASVDPVDVVNIIGEVVSKPKSISSEWEYEGFSVNDINVGDKAIFSHSVIYSFLQKDPEADPIYKNMIPYKGEEYFSCDIQNLYAIIRNGEIIMQNGYVMLYDFIEPKIILSAQSKRKIRIAESEVMHIHKPKLGQPELGVVPHETVYFNPTKAVKYQIGGKPFCIISQNHLLGKLVVTGQGE